MSAQGQAWWAGVQHYRGRRLQRLLLAVVLAAGLVACGEAPAPAAGSAEPVGGSTAGSPGDGATAPAGEQGAAASGQAAEPPADPGADEDREVLSARADPDPDPEAEPAVSTAPTVAAPVAVAAAPAAGGSPGSTNRSTELRAASNTDAKVLALLPAGAALVVYQRQGGWYRVAADGEEGWVRMLHVQRGSAEGGDSGGSELGTLAGLATGRSGTGNVVATTGVRGLNAEDLAQAEPDLQALAQVDSFAVTAAAAASQARAWALQPRTVAALAEPAGAGAGNKLSLGGLGAALPGVVRAALGPSDDEEVAAGRNIAAGLLAVAPPVADASVQREVNLLGRWLASQSSRPDLPWRFAVIDSADLNAFAAPGGVVLLTQGLYSTLADRAELAGVLAHEIAHVTLRHHTDVGTASKVLAAGARRLGDAVDAEDNAVTQRLVDAGASLFARRLDKDAEFSADRQGVVLAARGGMDPWGLPAVLMRLAAVSDADDRVALLFSTHPKPAERLAKLEPAVANMAGG